MILSFEDQYFHVKPLIYTGNLVNYANMQIIKIAQGCQGGKQAEFSFLPHLDHESIKKPYTYELFQVLYTTYETVLPD